MNLLRTGSEPVNGIDLSVVIAAGGNSQRLSETLRSLSAACVGLVHEQIVVHAGALDATPTTTSDSATLHLIERPAGTLIPVLWGIGATFAQGPVVAFTTTQLRVGPGWGRALHAAISVDTDRDTVGAAGSLALAAHASCATAATFFVRFSAFLPESVPSDSALRRDIPGDNAAYARAAIVRHSDLLQAGFWEVEFHRRFEREGLTLRLIPDASATMVGPVDFAAVIRERFEHAVEFGRSRVGRHGESALRIALGAPLVPAVLLVRTARRVLPFSRYRRPFVLALPWLVMLTLAWAVGEWVGAMRVGDPRPSAQP